MNATDIPNLSYGDKIYKPEGRQPPNGFFMFVQPLTGGYAMEIRQLGGLGGILIKESELSKFTLTKPEK